MSAEDYMPIEWFFHDSFDDYERDEGGNRGYYTIPRCRYCHTVISWHQLPSGAYEPRVRGKPHYCRRKAAPDQFDDLTKEET